MPRLYYWLVTGSDRSQRVYHGVRAGLDRAVDEVEQAFIADVTVTDASPLVENALFRLGESDDAWLRTVAREGCSTRGWLVDYSLYAALCGVAKPAYDAFLADQEEDHELEYFGWRWQHIGLAPEGIFQSCCDLIARQLLPLVEVARWGRLQR